MKKYTLLICALILATWVSFGQQTYQGRGGGAGLGRMYDVNSIVQVQGKIAAINHMSSGRGNQGIHITLQTGARNVDVHLGPSWYIDKQAVKLEVNDIVTVTGSEVSYNGDKIIIASKVTKGEKTLELRDTKGFPLWSGRGNR